MSVVRGSIIKNGRIPRRLLIHNLNLWSASKFRYPKVCFCLPSFNLIHILYFRYIQWKVFSVFKGPEEWKRMDWLSTSQLSLFHLRSFSWVEVEITALLYKLVCVYISIFFTRLWYVLYALLWFQIRRISKFQDSQLHMRWNTKQASKNEAKRE